MINWGPTILALMITFLASTGAAMLLGRDSQPPPSFLTRFSRCEDRICWNNLAPGDTILDVANRILSMAGYRVVDRGINDRMSDYVTYRHDTDDWPCGIDLVFGARNIVTYFRFNPCVDLRLGDLITILGPPDDVASGSLRWGLGTLSVQMVDMRSPSDPANCPDMGTPYSRVAYMGLGGTPTTATDRHDWRGFMPYWQYSRQFDLLGCAVLQTYP